MREELDSNLVEELDCLVEIDDIEDSESLDELLFDEDLEAERSRYFRKAWEKRVEKEAAKLFRSTRKENDSLEHKWSQLAMLWISKENAKGIGDKEIRGRFASFVEACKERSIKPLVTDENRLSNLLPQTVRLMSVE